MKHHIVMLQRESIEAHVKVRRPSFPHTWEEHGNTRPEQVAERLKDASIAIINKVPLRTDALERLPGLRLIAVSATGTDMIDKEHCRAKGIVICNVRDYATATVPEHTFALILALRRSLVGYRRDVEAGLWQKSEQFCLFTHPIHELRGSRLGIIGEGAIGQGVATVARAFGMEVAFAAHKGRQGLGPLYTPWEEVLERSDVITLHCPLLPETRDLIAMPEMRRMKRRPLLINTARGGLVNEPDLARALREGLIAGAAFDVATVEPIPDGHPLLGLLELPNFILTPHVAWASQEAMQELADQTIENIENFVKGTPSRVVAGAF